MCGGTRRRCVVRRRGRGLSPRVRGNRDFGTGDGAVRAVNGSIPACAGEPRHRDDMDHFERVYPRVCGGTPTGLTSGGKG